MAQARSSLPWQASIATSSRSSHRSSRPVTVRLPQLSSTASRSGGTQEVQGEAITGMPDAPESNLLPNPIQSGTLCLSLIFNGAASWGSVSSVCKPLPLPDATSVTIASLSPSAQEPPAICASSPKWPPYENYDHARH